MNERTLKFRRGVIEQMCDGIDRAPLDETVKIDTKTALRAAVRRNGLGKIIDGIPHKAPETNYQATVAQAAVSFVVGPIMREYRVPDPNGNDVVRHIYVALGGEQELEFEVPATK